GLEFQRQANRNELAELNYQRDMRMTEAQKEMEATSNLGLREQIYESALIDVREITKNASNQYVRSGYVQDLKRALPRYQGQFNDGQRRLLIANIESQAQIDMQRALEAGDEGLFADAMNRRLQAGTVLKLVYEEQMGNFYTDSLRVQVNQQLKAGKPQAAEYLLEQAKDDERINKSVWQELKFETEKELVKATKLKCGLVLLTKTVPIQHRRRLPLPFGPKLSCPVVVSVIPWVSI
ncbi:MAG: hypothetical protein ACYTEQ_30830, partial [Planctomycetota bacterium]